MDTNSQNRIKLSEFCAKPIYCRPEVEKPWSINGYTFATDGRILLRVSSAEFPAGPPQEKTPKIPFEFDHLKITNWQSLPPLPQPELCECDDCDGSGKITRCRSCRGTGECECDCGHQHDCGDCDGTGRKKALGTSDGTCERCEGSGKLTKLTAIEIGSAFVNADYLRKIEELPDCVIKTATSEDDPIEFKFIGGCGYVMPLKLCDEDKANVRQRAAGAINSQPSTIN